MRRAVRVIGSAVVLVVIPVLLPVATVYMLGPSGKSVVVPGSVAPVRVEVDGIPSRRVDRIHIVAAELEQPNRLSWLRLRGRPYVSVQPTGYDTDVFAHHAPSEPRRSSPGRASTSRRHRTQSLLAESRATATYVAARLAGVPVHYRGSGVLALGPSEHGTVEQGDVFVVADGAPLHTYLDLLDVVRRTSVRGSITLEKIDGTRRRLVVRPSRTSPALGFYAATVDASTVSTPTVDLRSSVVGEGNSAGFAFALGVYLALTRWQVERGIEVAATGAVGADGSVAPVSFVEQKGRAAAQAGIDVLVVPRGEGADARRFARSLRIVEAGSVREAISKLRRVGVLVREP